jgi:hypothetical protein
MCESSFSFDQGRILSVIHDEVSSFVSNFTNHFVPKARRAGRQKRLPRFIFLIALYYSNDIYG